MTITRLVAYKEYLEIGEPYACFPVQGCTLSGELHKKLSDNVLPYSRR
jgi:hypothetical protein